MQFINKDIKILVKHINKILELNGTADRVFIQEKELPGDGYIKHIISYYNINMGTFKETIIYEVSLRIKDNAPENIRQELNELISSEIYMNILIRTHLEEQDNRLGDLNKDEYWRWN